MNSIFTVATWSINAANITWTTFSSSLQTHFRFDVSFFCLQETNTSSKFKQFYSLTVLLSVVICIFINIMWMCCKCQQSFNPQNFLCGRILQEILQTEWILHGTVFQPLQQRSSHLVLNMIPNLSPVWSHCSSLCQDPLWPVMCQTSISLLGKHMA